MTNLFTTSSSRFLALQTRDPLSAYAFVYSVTTTKIYCRPTCSSRLARRANIVFHDTPAEATADGYRPCKRCRPDDLDGGLDQQVVMVEKICKMVRSEGKMGKGKWSVKGLAKEVGLTESHLCRVFRKVMGMTVGEYRISVRLNRIDSTIEGQQPIISQVSLPPPLESAAQLLPEDVFVPSPDMSDFSIDWNSSMTPEFWDNSMNWDLSAGQVDFQNDNFGFSGGETGDLFEFLDFGSNTNPAIGLQI